MSESLLPERIATKALRKRHGVVHELRRIRARLCRRQRTHRMILTHIELTPVVVAQIDVPELVLGESLKRTHIPIGTTDLVLIVRCKIRSGVVCSSLIANTDFAFVETWADASVAQHRTRRACILSSCGIGGDTPSVMASAPYRPGHPECPVHRVQERGGSYAGPSVLAAWCRQHDGRVLWNAPDACNTPREPVSLPICRARMPSLSSWTGRR
jgi:hypothetical protein